MIQQGGSNTVPDSPLWEDSTHQYENVPIRPPSYSDCQMDLTPPPPYEEICCNASRGHASEYDEDLENPYEIIPEEQTSARRCCHDKFTAPEIFMEHHRKRSQPFQAVINGHIVDYATIPVLTYSQGKKVLVRHCTSNSKFSNRVAECCTIYSSKYMPIFRYKLRSLCELRELVDKTKPYEGKKPTGTCCHMCVWDYSVVAPASFANGEKYLKMPNTERIVSCRRCRGNGKLKCKVCNGCGRCTCSLCHGSGQESMMNADCLQCNGGLEICQECRGCGIHKCKECEGRGQVINYQSLKVTWLVKENCYVDEMHGVPKKLLTRACGHNVYYEQSEGISKPITKSQLLHSKIIETSGKVIAQCKGSRAAVRKQRQTVDIVVVQQFNCRYKAKEFTFYLIGTNEDFYAPNFPSSRKN